MDLNWFESFLYGLFSGLGDILPISAEAHRILMLKIFGISGDNTLLALFTHLGIAAALFLICRPQLIRMSRAQALKRIPKRRRRRPLDTRSLMDISLLITMLVPVVLALTQRERAAWLGGKLIVLAGLALVNGVILYIPQFFPTANRDSRTMSRIEGLLMGLGGALGVVPGISSMGASLSMASICGVDRAYGLTMALLMNLGIQVGYVVLELLAVFTAGAGMLSFAILARYVATALVAFAGTYGGVKVMRLLADHGGYTPFAFYCWGLALLTFILNLMA